jgi:hypothetical protein
MLVTGKGKAKDTQEFITASVEALIGALESGHSEVLTSYLNEMARFHYYSFGNILLIATQKRDASQRACFQIAKDGPVLRPARLRHADDGKDRQPESGNESDGAPRCQNGDEVPTSRA